MPAFICNTCGTQYEPSDKPPAACPICDDERQYVPPGGQIWTTLDALQKRFTNGWRELEPNLITITTFPQFGIGQRAQLLRTPQGNILWDCISLVDRSAVELIKGLGGLKAIAISHPHYYGAVADWSEAFGGAPVYLHGDDRQWITRPHPAIVPWSGDSFAISDDIVLVRTGGHFAGGTILHWRAGAEGRGALLTGDVAMVAMDRKSLSFMYSFPNYIPLNAKSVRRVARAVEPLVFDRIYGAWWGRNIGTNAKAAFDASVRRYLAAISDQAGSGAA
jgi:glyoxylase-like metal-dependent hydrolase (beta-lactamase superfamily II)